MYLGTTVRTSETTAHTVEERDSAANEQETGRCGTVWADDSETLESCVLQIHALLSTPFAVKRYDASPELRIQAP